MSGAEQTLTTCAVCDAPADGPKRQVGGRLFCPEHYPQPAAGSRLWLSLVTLLAVMIGLGMLLQLVGPALDPLQGGWPPGVVAVALALLPVVIWSVVFRQFDAIEREPAAWEIAVVLLGCLVSAAVVEPLRRGVFELNHWWDGSAAWALPVYILAEGALIALAIYLVVRFSVFLSAEFDERADGIVYGALAGLSMGIPYNIRYVLDTPGLKFGYGTARIFVASLVLASVGAVIGFALGQVKFERQPAPFLAFFMLAAAALLGIFEWLALVLGQRGISFPAWQLFLLATLFALLVFGAVSLLARQALVETMEAP
ncbi:MAG: PrsW family glutamic-type intramembrane protease [Thermomicrobiales bacterium]